MHDHQGAEKGSGSTTDPVCGMTVDPAVTHIRLRPAGAMRPNQAGSIPSFSVSLLGRVK